VIFAAFAGLITLALLMELLYGLWKGLRGG